MLQALHIAARSLRKRSSLSLLVILILALGIGANTVVFSLVEAFLLRPFELEDPDRLMRLYATQEISGGDRLRITEGAFYDWRRESTSFDALIASRNMGLSVTDSPRPLNPLMRQISSDYFEVLGALPVMGRRFFADEYTEGSRVVILNFGFWQSYFGGDPKVLGRTIELNNEAYEVVGVMAAGFRNPSYPQPPVLWLPMPVPVEVDRRIGNIVVFARLAEGKTRADAAAEMDRLSETLASLYPETDAGRGVRVLSYRDSLVETVRPAIFALVAAVGLVLLLTTANVANLLLARATDRRQEIGVRLALGASRAHLLRQLFSESLILGTVAAGLGLLMAFWAIGPLPGLAPSNLNMPLLDSVELNGSVVLFNVVLALVTALVFGLLPMVQVLRVSGTEVVAASRGADRTSERRRLRSVLVVAEVALSLVLLIGAGLMVRSYSALTSLDLGFDPEGLVTVRTNARGSVYGLPERHHEFFRLAEEKLRNLPGVEKVGACEILPMFAAFRPSFPVHDRSQGPRADGGQERAIPLRTAVGFFDAFGTPILEGRAFTEDDRRETEPVAVVSRGLARRIWGEASPLGRTLVMGEGNEQWILRIVGIAGDLRGLAQSPEPPPILYLSNVQHPVDDMSFFLRSDVAPESLIPQAEDAIWSVNRGAPVYLTTTMVQMLRDIEWQPRFTAQLLSGFALFALILAATGLFAVLSYTVLERGREISIRVVVGAGRRDILRMVVGAAVRLTAIGLACGLVLTLWLSHFLEGQLYGITTTDPFTYGALLLVLTAIAVVASYLPALRAARVDPMTVLRSQ